VAVKEGVKINHRVVIAMDALTDSQKKAFVEDVMRKVSPHASAAKKLKGAPKANAAEKAAKAPAVKKG
jgi:hypothetical protein